MSLPPPLLVARLRGLGMRHPIYTYQAAHHAGLNLALACSILMQESGGGLNVYGHDPTVYIGAGNVTRWNYAQYRVMRDTPYRGARCQGVGPCQLTYVGFQDEADRQGGCWRPLVNMRVGFTVLAENTRRDGLDAGVAAYNGSGPPAEHYAAEVLARARGYATRLRLPAP